MGYLPEALLNYLARLGWAHGNQPTRMNSVITWPLSPTGTRRNRNGGEDAAYPPQDEKTP
jgi:hypothetical protein